MANIKLTGSERQPLEGARAVAAADPGERLEVSVLLRRRGNAVLKQHISAFAKGERPSRHMAREEFARQFGADPKDMARVRKFAGKHGLAVVLEHAARRTLVLSGSVAQFNAAFQVRLQRFEHPEGSYRGRTGPIRLPGELRGVVQAVLGLDNRPQAKPHFRRRRDAGPQPRAAAGSFTPVELASLYGFPAGDGKGECIAIVELGGGYKPADLSAYFKGLGLTAPKVIAVSVDHGANSPTGSADGPDGEVMLDIEVAGAVAPGATLAVYFAPNTDAGFVDAVTSAAHDTVNRPSVISISWGSAESQWTQQSMTALDEAFQAAAAMGVTVCVASGDDGSSDGVSDGGDHVDFPASSPHALGCGGTHLQAVAGRIASESVWNDGAQGGAGGGGVSSAFPLPMWQQGLQADNNGKTAALKMRGVPDVCGDADPETGYAVRVDGSDTVIGGTSAVAPLWAGLLARINALKGGSLGYINPALYQHASALNDITQGNNGDFAATPGWDACTGLGSPDGAALLSVLSTAPVGTASGSPKHKKKAKRQTAPKRRRA
jgi:kumamolisin